MHHSTKRWWKRRKPNTKACMCICVKNKKWKIFIKISIQIISSIVNTEKTYGHINSKWHILKTNAWNTHRNNLPRIYFRKDKIYNCHWIMNGLSFIICFSFILFLILLFHIILTLTFTTTTSSARSFPHIFAAFSLCVCAHISTTRFYSSVWP